MFSSHDLKRTTKRLGTALVALSLLIGLQTIAAPPARAIGATLTVSGTLEVGQTLTATPSGFMGTPGAYAWYRYSAASGGEGGWIAEGSTYTLSASDIGKYVVAFTSSLVDGPVQRERMGPIVVGFIKGTPSISGSAIVGSFLWADPGTWDPPPDSDS